MAEVAEANTYVSKIACRYYRHGICRKGDQCQYLHDFEPEGHSRFGEIPSDFNQQSSSDNNPLTLSHSELTVEAAASAAAVDWTLNADTWVKAWEFVPGQMWHSLGNSSDDAQQSTCDDVQSYDYDLCSGYDSKHLSSTSCNEYSAVGEVLDGADCGRVIVGFGGANLGQFMTGGDEEGRQLNAVEICDMCGQELPPTSEEHLRQKHIQECIRLHEEEMELSFAVQRSVDKVCGICMEVVWDKEPEKEARFGILSSCSHTFCLSCIRRWRAAQQFDKQTVKSCPECRVTSNFVVPSRYWVGEKDNKASLIAVYQNELSKKHCKYFNRGQGRCPFNEKCFYLHAYPDGRIASPRPVRRRATPSQQQEPQQHRHDRAPRTSTSQGQHSRHGRGDDVDRDDDDDDDGIFGAESPSLYEIIFHLNERVAQLANRLENSFLYRWMHEHRLDAEDEEDDSD